jgi:signal transduction histidine kinase/ActR/RegA family two-component response regulator
LLLWELLFRSFLQPGRWGFFPTVEIEAGITSESAPVLRIATDYDFCPNSYYNKDGELSGLYVEIMIEVANRLGMRPEFKTADWMGCRKMLTEDEVDVLTGLEIFSNMEGTLRTIPFCSDELRVYGRSRIDSAAALAGKKVALMARSVIATTYDLQCDYLEYSTNTEILEAVEQGEADFGICHGAVATKIIEKNHLHLVPSLVITKSYPALAVHDTQPKLQRMINEVVRDMSEDGTIGRLQNKWITEFARNRSLEYVFHQNEVFYITFILGIIIVLCITAGYWEVDRRQEKYIRTLLEYQEKLQQSNEETKRANQAKSEFLSHMSHDIRTPINGIMGMVEIIKKNLDDPERIKDCLEKIDKASHHLLSLINDVLDMSKIGSGKVHLEEIPVDLDEEMEKIHAIADVQAKKQEIRFSIEDEVVHRQFLGSPAHLRRILLNLISNALRYNKKGGKICLAIREVEYDGSHIGLEFKVQDTGIGMSREFVEKSLFKPFTQEDDRVRTEYRGTGLGMSIVYELVKQMNGTIDVNSKPGEGTTFTVKLAFKTVDSAWKKKEIQGENRNITGMNILAAEDNQLNMEILQFLLEEAGAKVTAVSDGKQAVEYFADAASGTYDVILMDIMMPVMDGLEASKKIRELPEGKGKDIPIIAMTANAFVEDKEKTKEAGMNAHLTKPVNREEIIRVLAAYWKNKG